MNHTHTMLLSNRTARYYVVYYNKYAYPYTKLVWL